MEHLVQDALADDSKDIPLVVFQPSDFSGKGFINQGSFGKVFVAILKEEKKKSSCKSNKYNKRERK